MSPCPHCHGCRYLDICPVDTVTLVYAVCHLCSRRTELACLGERIERAHQPVPKPAARKGRPAPRRTIHSRQAIKEAP